MKKISEFSPINTANNTASMYAMIENMVMATVACIYENEKNSYSISDNEADILNDCLDLLCKVNQLRKG